MSNESMKLPLHSLHSHRPCDERRSHILSTPNGGDWNRHRSSGKQCNSSEHSIHAYISLSSVTSRGLKSKHKNRIPLLVTRHGKPVGHSIIGVSTRIDKRRNGQLSLDPQPEYKDESIPCYTSLVNTPNVQFKRQTSSIEGIEQHAPSATPSDSTHIPQTSIASTNTRLSDLIFLSLFLCFFLRIFYFLFC